MRNLSIGNLSLDGMLILAPMAGFTDVSFRCLCKRFGASLTVSEMISAKGVFYGDRKTGQLAASSPSEKPFAVQIFGSEPDVMTVAAVSLLRLNPQIGIVDINMGCPMPKITGNGDGSALMKNLTLAGKIVAAVSVRSTHPQPSKCVPVGTKAQLMLRTLQKSVRQTAPAQFAFTEEPAVSFTVLLSTLKR